MDPVPRAGARPPADGLPAADLPRALTLLTRAEAPAQPLPPTGSAGARLLRLLPLLLMLLGAEIRVRQWLAGRSLWLDEALLAGNFTRGYGALLTQPLDHKQAAPVLWLLAERASITLAGTGERALRAVPLLAGLASLPLAWRLARRLLPPPLVPVALALVCLSPSLVYYSTEVKQYSSDVAVALALVLLALAVPRVRPLPVLLRLSAAGAVAVWASHSALLVLAGISLALVLRPLRGRDVRGAVRAALALSPWVLSLAVAYVLVLAPLRQNDVLAQFWGYTFPTGVADLPAWLVRRSADLVDTPLGYSAPVLCLLLLGVGTASLLRRDRPRALLSLSPVPVALVAAALSAYPFASRLALWFVPLAAVVLAAALPVPPDRPDRRGVAVLLALSAALTVVTGPSLARTAGLSVRVAEVEELRPLLADLAARRRPQDAVLVDIAAKAAFDYYAPRAGVPRSGVILFTSKDEDGGACDDALALRTARFARQRVWVVFSHGLVDTERLGSREDLVTRILRVTRIGGRLQRTGAEAVLFDPQAPPGRVVLAPANSQRCLSVVRTGG